jgi:CBS domain-containing protein
MKGGSDDIDDIDVIEIPREIRDLAEKAHKGEAAGKITVRELLRYFGAQRRGFYIVQEIKSALNLLKTKTSPDFEETWIDGELELVPIAPEGPSGRSDDEEDRETGTNDFASSGTNPAPPPDATLRIGILEAANTGVLYVRPNESIASAITKMLADDYSQLPVMTSDRDLKGIISWSTIGSRLALKDHASRGTEVRHYMEPAHEVRWDEALFDILPLIVERGYVLVRRDGTIKGIVTASDLSVQFRRLGEPFLLLSEIEQQIKNLIQDCVPLDDLKRAKDPADTDREVLSVGSLTLGEIHRVVQNEANWNRLGLIGVDRKVFITELGIVVKIRNDVMHFNTDPNDQDVVGPLQRFAKFLQRLRTARG